MDKLQGLLHVEEEVYEEYPIAPEGRGDLKSSATHMPPSDLMKWDKSYYPDKYREGVKTKLVVTIPAYNEEDSIGKVIREIPRRMENVDEVEIIVVNDGSADRTAEVAKEAGADNIVWFHSNKGLATAFKQGLNAALESGADVIVNIDADGQYNAEEIPKLIKPILDKKADIVLGNRRVETLQHMPLQKKIGNKIATFITSFVSGVKISDAQTGFRAFSREAALRINVLHDYTYVQETIIAAARKKLKIAEVPVEFRKRYGSSRLIPNIWNYAKRAGATILRTYVFYNPMKTFLFLGLSIVSLGFIVGLMVMLHYFSTGTVSPYLPTALLSALLTIVGFQIIVFGLIGDVLRHNASLVEEALYELKSRNLSLYLKR